MRSRARFQFAQRRRGRVFSAVHIQSAPSLGLSEAYFWGVRNDSTKVWRLLSFGSMYTHAGGNVGCNFGLVAFVYTGTLTLTGGTTVTAYEIKPPHSAHTGLTIVARPTNLFGTTGPTFVPEFSTPPTHDLQVDYTGFGSPPIIRPNDLLAINGGSSLQVVWKDAPIYHELLLEELP